MQPLVDSTPLAHDGDALRHRASRDGYLLLRGIPGPEVIAPLRRVVEDAATSLGFLVQRESARTPPDVVPGARLRGHGYDDPRWVELQQQVLPGPAFAAVGDHPALTNVLQGLIGGPLLTRRGDICRLALPRARRQTTPPHQDGWYTGGTTLWTVWIPLTDVPLSLGPIAVLPGSHHHGLLPHKGKAAGRQGVCVAADAPFAASDLAAGDAVLFHCLTIHRALPNLTRDRVRLSADYRYQPLKERSE